jgi:competence protein ComEC
MFSKAPLLPLAASLMAGIAASGLFVPEWWWLGVLTVVLLFCWRVPRVQMGLICVWMALSGMLLASHRQQHLQYHGYGESLTLEAMVVSVPQEKEQTMAMDMLTTDGHWRLKCYISKDVESRRLQIGDGLRLQTRIVEPDDYRHGTFSYRRYLAVNGFSGHCYSGSRHWQRVSIPLSVLPRMERVRLRFLKWRQQLLLRIGETGADGDEYGVIAAMALGDKSALSGDIREIYSLTGASHVLALSGLHLGIIYTLLSFLLRSRRRSVFSQVLLVAAVWSFVFLTGLSASVVRSATMLTLYAVFSVGGRRRMSVGALSFAALLMLLVNPLVLYDVGFQLSFAAVFSILVVLSFVDGLVSPVFIMGHRLLRWAGGLATVSVAAQMGVAPLIAYHFGRFSTYFLLTNFIVVPAATLILYGTLVMLLFPPVSPLVLGVVHATNTALQGLSRLPMASIGHLHPTVLQTVMAYVVLACLFLIVKKLSEGVAPYR